MMQENKGDFSSFTMDYEKDEIVVTIYAKDSQLETRFTEKDITSMQNWFDLARHMKNHK
jgi:tRNA threonylcarbamoyladenosine modification (KEOPS) complex  Pcc1 subunit